MPRMNRLLEVMPGGSPTPAPLYSGPIPRQVTPPPVWQESPAPDGQWAGIRPPWQPRPDPDRPPDLEPWQDWAPDREELEPHSQPIPSPLPNDRAYQPTLPYEYSDLGEIERRRAHDAERRAVEDSLFRRPKTHEQAGTRPPGHLDRLGNEVRNWYLPWWLEYGLEGRLPPELEPRLPPLPDGPVPK